MLHSCSPSSLLPLLGVSWDHPGVISREGSSMDRAGRRSCQLSACLAVFGVPAHAGLSSSCLSWCPSLCWAVLAPVPPGTALVSCTACEGRNRWKERLKRLWLSHCRPHPTTLALELGSEVLQLQPPHLLCGTFLPKGVNALCWFPF